MRIVGVIPARWGSTRFEGKVLAQICGKPMIQHVWERSRKSHLLDDLIIACDDVRIREAARQFGAKAVLTSPDLASGTDRIAQAVQKDPADIVINIQGDEPLIHHTMIDALAKALRDDPAALMATLIKEIQNPDELNDPNVVKVVIDDCKNALYFSRSVIPYDRDGAGFEKTTYYKHLGIYAYRKKFLTAFRKMPKSHLEQTERLEQLRALEAGVKLKTVLTKRETVGVDTPADLARVESLMK